MLVIYQLQGRDNQGRFTNYEFNRNSVKPDLQTEEFSVASDNGHGDYKVMRLERVTYTCTCPDHRFRQRDCKHIRSIQVFQKERRN